MDRKLGGLIFASLLSGCATMAEKTPFATPLLLTGCAAYAVAKEPPPLIPAIKSAICWPLFGAFAALHNRKLWYPVDSDLWHAIG